MFGTRKTVRGTATVALFNKAIRRLKREKIHAITRSCCSSCASYEASSDLQENAKLADFLGYCTLNDQTRDGAYESKDGKLYIGYGIKPLPSLWKRESDRAEQFRAAAEHQLALLVGRTLKLFFEREGFVVEWNGSTSRKLELTLPMED